MASSGFIFVHAGAGRHDHTLDRQVKNAMQLACQRGIEKLSRGEDAADAVAEAIAAMEDDESLNAGYGSNLTVDGHVECDASIIMGPGQSGSVGAVPGVRNPIRLAHAIMRYATYADPLGRIPPAMLVGTGAREFATHVGVALAEPADMISPRAQTDSAKWKERLEQASHPELNTNIARLDASALHNMQDTVGAIVSSDAGATAAGVSSGGLLLKLPGRVGEAGIYGAGCWAESRGNTGVACSVSGAGELIMRAMVCRHVADRVLDAYSTAQASSPSRDSPSHESDHMSYESSADVDVQGILDQALRDFMKDAPPELEPTIGIVLLVSENGSCPFRWAALVCIHH